MPQAGMSGGAATRSSQRYLVNFQRFTEGAGRCILHLFFRSEECLSQTRVLLFSKREELLLQLKFAVPAASFVYQGKQVRFDFGLA